MTRSSCSSAVEKRAIYCTGLSPLVNLLCSEKVTNETITYIDIDNIYDPKRFSKNHEREVYLARIFCDFFNVKFKSVGQVKCCIPPVEERTKTNYWYGKSDLKLKNGDLISSFTIALFNTHNIKIEIFAEGASALEWLDINSFSKLNFISKWAKHVKTKLRKIKNILNRRNMTINKRLIFGDQGGRIQFYAKNIENIEVVSFDIMNKNMKNLAIYLADIFPEIDYRSHSDSFIHLTIEEMSDELYRTYLKGLSNIIGNKKLIVKKHPRDQRSYINIFKNFDVLFVPEEFRSLPVELILVQSNIKLCSYISTALLSVDLDKVFIVEPPDEKIVELFNIGYKNLYKVLPLKEAILTLAELDKIQV